MTRRTSPRRPRTARVAVATASLGLLVLASCTSNSSSAQSSSSSGSAFGSLPAQSGTPQDGGVVRVAESPGAGPNYIFPITPSANGSVYNSYQFQNLMFRPLYAAPVGTEPKIDPVNSMASTPKFSDANKTVTFTLNGKYTWSDGKKVTANDVVFFVDLLKAAVKESAANFGNYTPGYFPDSVKTITAVNDMTVKMTLTKAFNPKFFWLNQLSLIIPFPSTAWNRDASGGPALDYTNPDNAKKIYDFLAKQAGQLTTYASNPLWQVVDGPFHLTAYNANTSGLSMKANEKYTGPQKARISELQQVPFTSESAEFNQLRSGNLDVGAVPFTSIAQVPILKRQGYNVYGYPAFGFEYVVYNFKDTTGHFDKVIAQPYIRQAFAHLQDQNAVVKGVYRNAAAVAYGPVPAIPKNDYTPSNASSNPYPFSISAAKKLLTDHGWNVKPGGTTTCARAGSGSNQCGAGIPAGTPLSWNFYYGNQPAVIGQQVTALVSAAKQVGISISTSSKTFNYLISNFSDVSAKSNTNKWAMMDFGGFSIATYPSTNQIFNTTGSYNIGGYHDPQADKLISNSVYGSDPQAVQKEAEYITKSMPGLFQPNPDLVFAWKGKLSGTPDSFSSLTQYQLQPEYWYFKK